MNWSIQEQEDAYIVYTNGNQVIEVSMLDTGEWVIYYGEESPDNIYTRNIYSQKKAMEEAQMCIRDYTHKLIHKGDLDSNPIAK